MGPLYLAAARTATESGVRIALSTRYTGRGLSTALLDGPDGPTRVRARFLVGADGARSRVAHDLALDRNRRLLIGAEELFPVPPSEQPPAFHCVLDPSLAPGYLAWVVNDGRHAHVGVAGHADRFPDGMRAALNRFRASAPGLPDGGCPDDVERRGGPIPVGGPAPPHLVRRRFARGRRRRGGLPADRRWARSVPAIVGARRRHPRRGSPDGTPRRAGALRRGRTARRVPRTAAPAPSPHPGAEPGRRHGGVHAPAHTRRSGGRPRHPVRRPVLPRSWRRLGLSTTALDDAAGRGERGLRPAGRPVQGGRRGRAGCAGAPADGGR